MLFFRSCYVSEQMLKHRFKHIFPDPLSCDSKRAPVWPSMKTKLFLTKLVSLVLILHCVCLLVNFVFGLFAPCLPLRTFRDLRVKNRQDECSDHPRLVNRAGVILG